MISLELTEWHSASPKTDARLRGVRLASPSARKVATRLTEQGILSIVGYENGLAVHSFSHVGRIELDGLVITVHPKLAPEALLDLLRYAYSLSDLRLFDNTGYGSGSQGLQDLIIAQLQAEAGELLHRGIVRRYVRRTEDLGSPRGRIEVGRLARDRNPASVTLPCTYHVRSSNYLLNQVVRAGLELARSTARAPLLKRAVAHTAAHFADIAEPIKLTSAIIQDALRGVDRLSAAYEPVLRLVEMIYDAGNLTFEDGESLRLKGFLFDMNRFFQALVSKFLHESLPYCTVEEEVSLQKMMAYAPGYNPRQRKSPRPRPDFVVTRGRTEKHILDAKYRDLWRRELPREMLYQLAIYAMSQPQGSTAAILYPTDDLSATEAIVDIREPISNALRAHVAMRPVVIPRLLALLQSEKSSIQAREALAESLVFGSEDFGGRMSHMTPKI